MSIAATPSGKKARVTMKPGFSQRVTAHVERQLDKAGLYATNYMRELVSEGYPPASEPWTPPHVRTGNLRRSIGYDQVRPLHRRIGLQGADETVMHYGICLEYGTGPHAIMPGAKGFLAWKNEAGEWVFTRKPVQQKGMLPRPYIRRTIWDIGSELQIIITNPMKN